MKIFIKTIFTIVLSIAIVSCSKEDSGYTTPLSGKTYSFSSTINTILDDSGKPVFTSVNKYRPSKPYLESYENTDFPYGYYPHYPPLSAMPPGSYEYIGVSEGFYTFNRNELISDSIVKIEFSDKECVLKLHSTRCKIRAGSTLNCKIHTFKFKEGTYNLQISFDYTVIITKDLMTIFDGDQKYMEWALNDYKYSFKGKCDFTKLIDPPVDILEKFEYVIDGEDILFFNDKRRMRGVFNLYDLTLKIWQTYPKKLYSINLEVDI